MFLSPVCSRLCNISKILKIESKSQLKDLEKVGNSSCVISQRYSKLKVSHNCYGGEVITVFAV